MARSVQIVLTEMMDAIALAKEAVAGLTFLAFSADRIRVAAAQRALEIISEASRHLPAEVLDRHVSIPWQDIRVIGNKLRHQYFKVDNKIVWDVVQLDLDALDMVAKGELQHLGP